MMILRENLLRSNDATGQLNRPEYNLRRKAAQRGGPVSKMSLAMADHLKILPVELDMAQDDTRPSRPEEGEERIIRTKGQARRTGTRCQRARRRRPVRLQLI